MPVGEECSLFEDLILPRTAQHQRKEYYSAFFRTDLEDTLRRRGITRVVICGVMTHLCCETTARDAFMSGWEVAMVADGTATLNEELHLSSLRCLVHGFAMPALAEEVLCGIRT